MAVQNPLTSLEGMYQRLPSNEKGKGSSARPNSGTTRLA
jgi:hypothetical protein